MRRWQRWKSAAQRCATCVRSPAASAVALLTQQPDLLFLDEPSSHLNLAHQLALTDRLSGLARSGGKAVLMVLHDVNLAVRCCDHALLLDGGVAQAGTAQELLTAARLSRLYGVPLNAIETARGPVFAPG